MRVHITLLAATMLTGQAIAGSITVIGSSPPTSPRSVEVLQDTPMSAPAGQARDFSASSRSVLTQIDPKGTVSGETVAAVPAKPDKKNTRQDTVMVMRGGIEGEAFPVPQPEPAAKADKQRRASELITGKKWLSQKKPEASPPAASTTAQPAPAAP